MRPSPFIPVLVACMLTGCVRRTITVTSDPSGALVWLNGKEVGRTPLTVDFLHYGTYDVQLVAEGYEPLLTTGRANPPWWDNVPLDFFAEITPGKKTSHIAWHYQLEPENNDPQALVNRARELRERIPPPTPAAATQPTGAADAAAAPDAANIATQPQSPGGR